MNGWLPIETAPKDGTEILALYRTSWMPETSRRIVYWHDGNCAAGAYSWPCWMCAVATIQLREDSLFGWQSLPSLPPTGDVP